MLLTQGTPTRRAHPVLLFVAVVEPYERITAKADEFPANKERKEIVGENDELHAPEEEVHEEPVPGQPLLPFHVL